jgi:hypothetical protein
MILESMAARKDLKGSHYKVYLCMFSGVQEGVFHTEEDLKRLTKMHQRTVQKTVRELIETGNIEKDEDGYLHLSFTSGLPATTQSVSPDLKSIMNSKKEIHDTPKKNILTSSAACGPQRHKELVDGLFAVYEKQVGVQLNQLFTNADGAMVKRLLKNMPEVSIKEFLKSFKNFLWTEDEFDAQHVRENPVRFWTSRVVKYLPQKKFDVVEAYKNRKRDND